MSYKYNNVVIKPGLYLGDQNSLTGDIGASNPIYSSMQLSLAGTNDLSRRDDNFFTLPGFKAILYKNTDISYSTVYTIDNTDGTNIKGVWNTTYNTSGANQISKVDLFFNNVKINYSNIKPIGFKAAAKLCWGAKLAQHSDGKYNKYALVLESSTPRISLGFSNETSGVFGYNRPHLSLPWIQPIVTSQSSYSFWWCSKGYEIDGDGADIDYTTSLYGSGSTGTVSGAIYALNNSTSYTQIFLFQTGNLAIYQMNSGTSYNFRSTKNICDGLWHHIVWNMTGGASTIYTDGVAETFTHVAFSMGAITTGISTIGVRALSDITTNGCIADFRFYKKILTTTDITGLLSGDHTYQTSLDGTTSCMFQYTFDPSGVYTNNYTTYAIGAATVPYAAELRNGAEIMLASMDLSESLGKNIKICPFTIGSNGFSISFWWKSDGKWDNQGASSHLFYLGNGNETDNINFSLSLLDNGPSISVNTSRIYLSGCVIHYKFEGNAINSGPESGLDGTLVGTGSYSSSIYKIGSQSFLTNASSPITFPTLDFSKYTSGFTIAFWFYKTSNPPAEPFVEIGNGVYLQSMNIVGWPLSGKLYVYFRYGGYDVGDIEFPLNKWNHYAVTVTYNMSTTWSSTWKAYANGILKKTKTGMNFPRSSFNINEIGQFAGYMDDFRLYKKVLTATEIYNLAKSNYSKNNSTALSNFCDDTWKHVVWTMAPDSTWNLYINNSLFNTYTGMDYPNVIQRSVNTIGGGYLTTDGYPCGYIGDFRTYNSTLSSTNVTSLYNQTNTSDNEINLTQHYDFVEETMNANNNILYSNAPRYALELTNVAATDSASIGQYGYMPSGLAATGTNGLTISFWWKATGWYEDQGTWCRIFDFAENLNGDNAILFACKYSTNLYPSLEMNRGNAGVNRTTVVLSSLTDFCDGDWKHVVWTMTNATTQTSTWNIYVNNNRYGLGNLTRTGWYPNDIARAKCFIGKSWAVDDGYPNGQISDVRVYGEVFTSEKITDLYNKVYTSTTNLILQTLTPTSTPPKISDEFLDLINAKSPWGIYFADSHANNILYEARNNGRNASTIGINKNYARGDGAEASIPYINGTTSSTITWPDGSIPTTYTICSITRYTGSANNGRILVNANANQAAVNFLHGHWANKRGVAHYNAWKTAQTSVGTITDWLVMCGTNGTNGTPGNILRDGTAIGTANGGTGNSQLTVNSFEPSDFALSTVFIWDQALTNAEMVIVSNALKYYLSSGKPMNLGLGLGGAKIPTSITQKIPYNSLYLDGTEIKGAQASLSADLITNAGVSFAFWFKPTGAHGAVNPMIFDFGNGQASDNIFFAKDSASNSPYIKIYLLNTGSNYFYLSNNSTFFSEQVWKHAVWTMTYSTEATSTWNVYINGQQYGSAPLTTTGYYPNSLARTNCLIGKSNWSADGLLNGQIADFRVYNSVLTQANVTALYNGIYTDNTSLFLQYPIDKAGTTNPNTITFTLQSQAKIQVPTILLASTHTLKNNKGSYLSLPPLANTDTNGVSFSFWWRAGSPYSNQGNWSRLFSFSNGKTQARIEFVLKTASNFHPTLSVDNGIKSIDSYVTELTTLCDGTWKHIVWTMSYCEPNQNTSTFTLYINGTSTVITTAGIYPKNVLRKYAYIGKSAWLRDAFPTGDFADFRVYKAFLSQANVNSLYALSDTTDKEGFLMLRQKFDSTESHLYQTCDNIKPSVMFKNDPAITNVKTAQHVVLPSLPGLISTDGSDRRGMSFSFWWKSKGLSGMSGMLFELGFAENNDNLFLRTRSGLNTRMNAQFFYGPTIDSDVYLTGDGIISSLENDEWHHIVWTLSFEGNDKQSYWKYYMDGYFLKTSGLLSVAYPDSSNSPRYINNFIGRSSWTSNAGSLNGYMSDFRIYNKCLTTEDVSYLYTNTYTDNSSLFLRYTFEENKKIENIFNNNIYNYVNYDEQIASTNKTIKINFSANAYTNTSVTDHPMGLTTAFDTGGNAGHCQLSSMTNGNDGMSFAFWFKPTGTSGSAARIFDFGNGAPSDNIIFFRSNDTNNPPTISLYRGGTETTKFVFTNKTSFFTNGTGWQHVVWTLSFCADTATTSIWNVYFDGSQYGSAAVKTDARYPGIGPRNSNYIGKSNVVTDGALYGMLTDFRIYNRVLSSTEATALYNNSLISNADLYFSTNFALNVPQNYTPSHSTDSTQLGRLYNGATLSTDTYKFGTSSLFLSNFSTTTNPVYTSGIGYGQYMSTIAPLPKLGTNGISISFWWKSAGTQASPSVVFCFSENTYNNIVFWINSSPSLQVINKAGTVYGHTFTQTNFLDGNWHHIVMNLDKYNNTWQMFYDNVSSGTLTDKYYPENVSRPQCFFGRPILTGQYYANGYIDEFRIHSNTLSAENVNSLYNNNDSSAVDKYLVLYYSFNQDASKTKMDEIYLDNNILDTPIFNI
jgi:hypothetical protein